jgi:hypothetical protein
MLRRTRLTLAAVAAALTLTVAAGPASAATLNVCPSGCTYSTIQAAVDAAHSGDTIKIAAAVNPYDGFNVPGANLNGLTRVTLTGAGAAQTTIDNGGAGSVVDIDAGAALTLGGVTLTGGHGVSADFGGGIENLGTLTLTDSIVTGNTATNTSGGGISNDGTATLNHSQVNGNTAATNLGGGIFNDIGATLTLNNSSVSGNAAANGGGIFNFAKLTLNNSSVSGNAAVLGGGIHNLIGTVTLSNSSVRNNTASDSGGGLYNDGRFVEQGFPFGVMTVSNSSVRCNVPDDVSGPYTQKNSKIGPAGPC